MWHGAPHSTFGSERQRQHEASLDVDRRGVVTKKGPAVRDEPRHQRALPGSGRAGHQNCAVAAPRGRGVQPQQMRACSDPGTNHPQPHGMKEACRSEPEADRLVESRSSTYEPWSSSFSRSTIGSESSCAATKRARLVSSCEDRAAPAHRNFDSVTVEPEQHPLRAHAVPARRSPLSSSTSPFATSRPHADVTSGSRIALSTP